MTEDKEGDRKFEVRKKVDEDWKRKVQLEKARMAGAEPPKAPARGAPKPEERQPPSQKPSEPPPSRTHGMNVAFVTLVQQLADQAAVFLGLVPGYEKNCEQAGMAIEMLRALQEKTRGNLSAEESKALSTVLYELQMRYVQACGGGAP